MRLQDLPPDVLSCIVAKGCIGGWSALRCVSKGMMRLCERTDRETNVWRDLFCATFPRMQVLLHGFFSFSLCTEDWQRWRVQYVSCIGQLCSLAPYLYFPGELSVESSDVWGASVSSGKDGTAARAWSVHETLERTVSRATAFLEGSHGDNVQKMHLNVYVPLPRYRGYVSFSGRFPLNNLLLSRRKNGVVFSACVDVSWSEPVPCPFLVHLQARIREEIPEKECSCTKGESDSSDGSDGWFSSDDEQDAQRFCRTFNATCSVRLQTNQLTAEFLRICNDAQGMHVPFATIFTPVTALQ